MINNLSLYVKSKENWPRLVALLAGMVAIVYSIYFYFANCYDAIATKKTNFYYAAIFIVMIAVVVYLLTVIMKGKEWNYPRTFVIMALGWTFCMQLVMPPISGVDEVQHFYSAYHCSNIMMGMKDHNLSMDTSRPMTWVEGESFFYMRGEDYNMLPYVDVTFPYQYPILANGNWITHYEDQEGLVECKINPTRASRYLVSGVGITIARLLGFGFSGVVFLGRFMNSLSLIIAGWIALKLLPVGKLQFVTFALFPTVLSLCSSYSYDNMSILFSLALLTLCLYYSQDQVKLHAWDLIILAGCVIMLVPNKTVYALFAVWIFAIPVKKWWKDVVLSKKWYEYVILGILGTGAVAVGYKVIRVYYWYVVANVVWRTPGVAMIEQDPSKSAYTIYDIYDNPLGTLKFAWEGIKVDFWYNIKHIVGSEIGHVMLNAQVPMFCVITMLLCLIVGLFIVKGKRIKKWQMVIIGIGLFLCVAAIFIGCLSRFTPAEGSQRIQISFRYLIPVYMCMCIALGSDAKEDNKQLALIYIQNIALVFSMCGLLYFLFHLRDGMEAPEILKGILGQ
ncbi:Predicted membrane protein [Pseudobutyrivibrio sp. YE44]|uniref:DUF2142 domain-containing protein n=1 Tax=Pseudobutyrivibrio sp. YE44 TaxID=1520802 RepID=UPI00088CD55E|nr:DUF2142 domain-containing protein [Pseudobutyrivibrio sp. YE44]SDB38549.1 Predicted membrane protein [Pseudobutyrivibrio sp. YE44]